RIPIFYKSTNHSAAFADHMPKCEVIGRGFLRGSTDSQSRHGTALRGENGRKRSERISIFISQIEKLLSPLGQWRASASHASREGLNAAQPGFLF
ncbi:hypothetical protein FQA47_010071, partial [Oryzias melastigma]